MRKVMKKLMLLIFAFAFSGYPVWSEVVTGVFKTNPSEETGGYLHIEFGSCKDNKQLSCGIIKTAVRKDGSKNAEYEHLGELMVWNMKAGTDGKYKGGKIWDPSENNEDGSKKIYNSKMELNNDILRVDGCILFFCKGQDWERVN
tara:strand:+ start:84 stop:518 length:435 start_codon:yes stop_codon:yes gene_type:complete